MHDVIHTAPTVWPRRFDASVRCDNGGFTLGVDTPLIRCRGDGRPAIEGDSPRCLALLSVLCRRPIGPQVLDPIQAAAAYWAAGDKALANLRLVFSGLPKLESPADAARLQAAAYCLDNGMAPRNLMKALDLDPSVLDLVKFDPDQPRVPAGNGQESGRWTSDGVDETTDGVVQTVVDAPPNPSFETSDAVWSRATPNIVPVAADGPYKPEGTEVVPSPPIDPLDPFNLNKQPPNTIEQQAIVDTLNIIKRGRPDELKELQPHNYQNLPHKITGAVLPPDTDGYNSYTVRFNDSKIRGEARLVINRTGNKAYYTSNHYYSFYGVDIDQ